MILIHLAEGLFYSLPDFILHAIVPLIDASLLERHELGNKDWSLGLRSPAGASVYAISGLLALALLESDRPSNQTSDWLSGLDLTSIHIFASARSRVWVCVFLLNSIQKIFVTSCELLNLSMTNGVLAPTKPLKN